MLHQSRARGMSDCIFCNIAAGTMKAEVVFENPHAIGFLDKYPVTRGHVVVIPRVHAATLNELADDAVGGLFLAVKAVMRQVSDALRPVAMNVGWNHGKDAGQVVLHLHVHVLPRYSAGGHGVQALGEGAGQVSFPELAEAIRKA
jgi:histidine triad (HIT) family protein